MSRSNESAAAAATSSHSYNSAYTAATANTSHPSGASAAATTSSPATSSTTNSHKSFAQQRRAYYLPTDRYKELSSALDALMIQRTIDEKIDLLIEFQSKGGAAGQIDAMVEHCLMMDQNKASELEGDVENDSGNESDRARASESVRPRRPSHTSPENNLNTIDLDEDDSVAGRTGRLIALGAAAASATHSATSAAYAASTDPVASSAASAAPSSFLERSVAAIAADDEAYLAAEEERQLQEALNLSMQEAENYSPSKPTSTSAAAVTSSATSNAAAAAASTTHRPSSAAASSSSSSTNSIVGDRLSSSFIQDYQALMAHPDTTRRVTPMPSASSNTSTTVTAAPLSSSSRTTPSSSTANTAAVVVSPSKRDPVAKQACIPCRRLKVACEDQRPCPRCIRFKRECVDRTEDEIAEARERKKRISPAAPVSAQIPLTITSAAPTTAISHPPSNATNAATAAPSLRDLNYIPVTTTPKPSSSLSPSIPSRSTISSSSASYVPPGIKHDNPLYVNHYLPGSPSSLLPTSAHRLTSEQQALKKKRDTSILTAVASAPKLTSPPVIKAHETANGLFDLMADEKIVSKAVPKADDSGIKRIYLASADDDMKDINDLANPFPTALKGLPPLTSLLSSTNHHHAHTNHGGHHKHSSSSSSMDPSKKSRKRPHDAHTNHTAPSNLSTTTPNNHHSSSRHSDSDDSNGQSKSKKHKSSNPKANDSNRTVSIVPSAKVNSLQVGQKRPATEVTGSTHPSTSSPPTSAPANHKRQKVDSVASLSPASITPTVASPSLHSPATSTTPTPVPHTSPNSSTPVLMDLDMPPLEKSPIPPLNKPTPAIGTTTANQRTSPILSSASRLSPSFISRPLTKISMNPPVIKLESDERDVILVASSSPPVVKRESKVEPVYDDHDDDCLILSVSHSQEEQDAFNNSQQANENENENDEVEVEEEGEDDDDEEEADDESGSSTEDEENMTTKSKKVRETIDMDISDDDKEPTTAAAASTPAIADTTTTDRPGFRQLSHPAGDGVMLEVDDSSDEEATNPRPTKLTTSPVKKSNSTSTAQVVVPATNHPSVTSATPIPARRVPHPLLSRFSMTPFCPLASRNPPTSNAADVAYPRLKTKKAIVEAPIQHLKARQKAIFDDLLRIDREQEEMADRTPGGVSPDLRKYWDRMIKQTDALNQEDDWIRDELDARKQAVKRWRNQKERFLAWQAKFEVEEEEKEEAEENKEAAAAAATTPTPTMMDIQTDAKTTESTPSNAASSIATVTGEAAATSNEKSDDLDNDDDDEDEVDEDEYDDILSSGVDNDDDELSETDESADEDNEETVESPKMTPIAPIPESLPEFAGHKHIENAVVKIEREYLTRETGVYDPQEAQRQYNQATAAANPLFLEPEKDEFGRIIGGGDSPIRPSAAASSIVPSIPILPAMTAAPLTPSMPSAAAAAASSSTTATVTPHVPTVKRKKAPPTVASIATTSTNVPAAAATTCSPLLPPTHSHTLASAAVRPPQSVVPPSHLHAHPLHALPTHLHLPNMVSIASLASMRPDSTTTVADAAISTNAKVLTPSTTSPATHPHLFPLLNAHLSIAALQPPKPITTSTTTAHSTPSTGEVIDLCDDD